MTLLILSFLAGALTIAAPCTFTLLPVIVGGSLARTENKRPNIIRPLIICASLGISIIFFTLILKFSTSLLGIPTMVWQFLSGIIILLLGITFIRPGLWEQMSQKSGLYEKSNKFLGKSFSKNGFTGDFLTGVALGPVFSSCNPTYAFVVASILPRSFAEGLIYLIAYAVGLSGILLVVSFLGQNILLKLGWLNDPNGKFRKSIGIIFLVVGVSIALGFDKKFEAFIIERGLYDPVSTFEESLR